MSYKAKPSSQLFQNKFCNSIFLTTIGFILLLLLLTMGCSSYQQVTKLTDNIFYCGYSANNGADKLCEFLQENSFATDQHAKNAVNKILNPLGLSLANTRFILVSCPKIQNAVAITTPDGIRYIVYDNEFMSRIDRTTSDWASLSILAHEIGHHFCGHTLKKAEDISDQRRKELEADEWSGFILCKLGATLEQSQSAVYKLTTEEDENYSTHPRRSKRLEVIKLGYNNAKVIASDKKNQSPFEGLTLRFPNWLEKNHSAEQYINEGRQMYEQKRYKEAIDKYTSAINLRPNYPSAYNNRGIAKYDLKDYTGAIQDYNKAIQLNSNFAEAYNNRGNAKYALKDYTGAIQDYNKAIQLNPNFAIPYSNRGNAKRILNDDTGACIDYKKSCDLGNVTGCDHYRIFCEKKLKLRLF